MWDEKYEMRPFYFYLIAYVILSGFHITAISYPEGAWNDDWIGYYASSARWLSATGPMEVGRRVMVDAFDPSTGTPRDWEVARAVFNTSDPYMGWAKVHAVVLRFFRISPDSAFLVLQLAGCVLYLTSLRIFIRTAISELKSQERSDEEWLTGLVVLLQASYLGNPLLIGPIIFNPAMFVLPFILLFLGFLPRASCSWIRLFALYVMIPIHSSGIIAAVACLGASFLYRTIGAGSGANRSEKIKAFWYDVLAVIIPLSLVVVAARLQWIPSPYPLSLNEYRLGLDILGIRRVGKFVGISFVSITLLIIPFGFYQWYRSPQRSTTLPFVFIVWITLGVCFLGMLSLVQTWTVQQSAIVRFMYVAWPLLLVSVFVILICILSWPGQSRINRAAVAVAILLIVASNIRDGLRFQKVLANWRNANNCRFLLEPTREEIQRLSKFPGGLVIVFNSRAGGSISFIAGGGDYPVYYSRLTPDWRDRVEAQGKRFVLVVAPLLGYPNKSEADSDMASGLDEDKWLIAHDVAVSRKGTVDIGGDAATLSRAAEALHHPGWGCDGTSGSVYRLTVYKKASLATPAT